MPTTPRGIAYPASTDAPRVWEDMQELADSVETALDALDHDGTTDTAIGTAAVNFTATTALARTALGGKLVFLKFTIVNTNAINPNSFYNLDGTLNDNLIAQGNIGDTTVFTLDSEYWPTEVVAFSFDNGVVSGTGIVSTSGVVSWRAASDTIPAGSNNQFNVTFLKA